MQTKRGRFTLTRGIVPIAVLCASTIGCSGRARTGDRFYGIVNSPAADAKLVSIDVRDHNEVTIAPIGAIGTFGCTSVALSKQGTLYSICGPADFADTQHKYGCMTPGPQQLATIDPKTVGLLLEAPPSVLYRNPAAHASPNCSNRTISVNGLRACGGWERAPSAPTSS